MLFLLSDLSRLRDVISWDVIIREGLICSGKMLQQSESDVDE
jgi:hypothetical protein